MDEQQSSSGCLTIIGLLFIVAFAAYLLGSAAGGLTLAAMGY